MTEQTAAYTLECRAAELDAKAERNRDEGARQAAEYVKKLNGKARPDFAADMQTLLTPVLKDRVELRKRLLDTRDRLNTAERNLREVREYIEQARCVVDRLPDSPERHELTAILEQRFAVVGECSECEYPLFSREETVCRFCSRMTMVEHDRREEAKGEL